MHDMNNDIAKVLISEEQLQAKVAELGAQISRDYEGQDLLLVSILKGSVVFMADLMRAITEPCSIDFMVVSSYGGANTTSTGLVKIVKDLDQDLSGKDVLIVEDILDTGVTLSHLVPMLKLRRPNSVRLCTILSKPSRRKVDIEPDYCGFEVPDEFVVGYGLDYDEKYRNLPYVGVGASRVRDLFEKAKKTMPSIIFIDEIDAVGRQRGAGLGGGHDEREQTLNQLLVEMDGFDANDGVIVMAATNRADILDKALLRPGRFDRQVYVGLPDVKGREEILRVHTKNKPLGPDVSLKTIAKSTAGFSGADLENLVNEAALLAARKGKKAITEPEIEEASIKVVAGPEKKSRVVTDAEKRLTSYHEAGHAITGYFCKTHDPVHQISIIPRGSAGGFTMYLPEKDPSYVTKTAMNENIVCLLGGRVAEQLVLDDISTGASNDLQRATDTARAMVTRYGFSERMGPVVYGTDPGETFLGRDFGQGKGYSENTASEIDNEIRDIMDESYETARRILTEHMTELHRVAGVLMEREKISGEEFDALMKGENLAPFGLDTPAPAAAPASAEQPAAPEQPSEPSDEN